MLEDLLEAKRDLEVDELQRIDYEMLVFAAKLELNVDIRNMAQSFAS
jgi:hypothetical protein